MSLIRDLNKMSQVIDFTGLSNGVIHPTDIDVVLEFDDEFLILMELKTKGSRIPTGQRLVLERMVDSWNNPCGKKAIALYVTHNFKNPSNPILLESCSVDGYYKGGGVWVKSKEKKIITVKEFLSYLSKHWKVDKLKDMAIKI